MGLYPGQGPIGIRVFAVTGVLVRKLADNWEAGGPVPAWDGRNDRGETVASGVYLVVITGDRLYKRLRVAVMK